MPRLVLAFSIIFFIPAASMGRNIEPTLQSRTAHELLFSNLDYRTDSVASNIAVLMYMNSYSTSDEKLFTLVSAVIGLLPLWVKDRQIYAYEKNADYKHNAYAPVTGIRLMPRETERGNKIQPLLNMAWRF